MSEISSIDCALIALFAPLVAAAIIGIAVPLRKQGMPAAVISVTAALASLGASLLLLSRQVAAPETVVREVTEWLPEGTLSVAEVGLHIDGTSASMLLIVTLVASAVQIFSLGYMANEPKPAFGRYYGYHSLFIFAMNLLVLAPNLLLLFIGWELVGLTSYLLIGFYYTKPSAAKAAVKAFWFTKFADMGLLLGLLVLYTQTGSFNWTEELSTHWANVVTMLFFLAVMGKSAQFPLHCWLPNAMEGPTPVSALLHAATMVAAGVFLVVRADPLFAQAPATQFVMMSVGAFSALFAAIIATVQTDIKRVLAYSTCSQLGYMICALGVGSLMGGYFHLTTHAFFKALLFLSAGSVIHAVHSNEMSDMGGLWSKMKVTSACFIVGSLALAGVPGLAGFFSKDLIVEAVYEADTKLPWLFLQGAAFLTAFYMGRVVFLTFFGKPSKAAEKAHESGPAMLLPLIVLAVGAVGIGYMAPTYAALYGVDYHFHMGFSGIVATVLGLSGITLSWLMYGKGLISEKAFDFLQPLRELAHSGAVDETFDLGYRKVMLVGAAGVAWFDRYIIDGVMNWIGYVTIDTSRTLRKWQTGNVRDYVLAVVGGVVALGVWGLMP